MAKTKTKAGAAKRPTRSSAKARTVSASSGSRSSGGKSRSGRFTGDRGQSSKSAADALIGLLESPLVADILAAGAAAALAAIAQRGLSRRQDGSSKAALKNAAKAAATAMGARISEELDEILASAKESRRGRA